MSKPIGETETPFFVVYCFLLLWKAANIVTLHPVNFDRKRAFDLDLGPNELPSILYKNTPTILVMVSLRVEV